MRYASRCGWHSCVFNRRGHAGVRLTSSKFNVVGDPADAVIMVDRVRDRYSLWLKYFSNIIHISIPGIPTVTWPWWEYQQVVVCSCLILDPNTTHQSRLQQLFVQLMTLRELSGKLLI